MSLPRCIFRTSSSTTDPLARRKLGRGLASPKQPGEVAKSLEVDRPFPITPIWVLPGVAPSAQVAFSSDRLPCAGQARLIRPASVTSRQSTALASASARSLPKVGCDRTRATGSQFLGGGRGLPSLCRCAASSAVATITARRAARKAVDARKGSGRVTPRQRDEVAGTSCPAAGGNAITEVERSRRKTKSSRGNARLVSAFVATGYAARRISTTASGRRV